MSLDPNLHIAKPILGWCKPSYDDRISGIEGSGKLVGDFVQHNASIGSSFESFSSRSCCEVENVKLGTVDVKLLLQHCFLRVVPLVLTDFWLRRLDPAFGIGKSLAIFLLEAQFEFLFPLCILRSFIFQCCLGIGLCISL